jgi:4-hydroxy-tetrahydrodipicolinate reductase
MVRIGIAGIGGRVGRLLIDEIAASGATLAGGTDRHAGLATLPPCDVVIDFTHPDTVLAHADALSRAGIAWVIGTTGLSDAQQRVVEIAASTIAIVQASNFSPGVVLMQRLARQMAATLPAADYDAEILEAHHRQKVDAPSGTALSLGRSVADGRSVRLDDVRQTDRAGPRPPGAIGFASLRGGQIVGEHTLSFTSGAEQLCLTHRAFDRRVFAAGAVRAALWTRGRAPGLYGMETVLGLD